MVPKEAKANKTVHIFKHNWDKSLIQPRIKQGDPVERAQVEQTRHSQTWNSPKDTCKLEATHWKTKEFRNYQAAPLVLSLH